MQASTVVWVVVIGAAVALLVAALIRSPRRGRARRSTVDAGAAGWFGGWSDGGGFGGDGGGGFGGFGDGGGCGDGGGGGC